MTDLYLLARSAPVFSVTRIRVPRARSLVTYGPPGGGMSAADVRLLASGGSSGPAPYVHSGDAVDNMRLVPVSDAELAAAEREVAGAGGELATLPESMWLCASPTLCSASRHVCTGVLGPAFDDYDRIHLLVCEGPAAFPNDVVESLARQTDAFLEGDYATTRTRWEGLGQAHRARYLAFEGVVLWHQVHSCQVRTSGAEGEFIRLYEFESVMTREHRDTLASGAADHWPWARAFIAQLEAEQQVLTGLERHFDPAVWTGLSEVGRMRALEILRGWGSHYLDTVEDAITAAGLVVPGHLTSC
ncbi:hypothetical protein [Streptomyces sp. NBC_00096]|uniref:hypothetical protein n=1 Tax=Streptomyces sp. NBC_00096 TaxID=2975650 RepID=UPI003251CFE3